MLKYVSKRDMQLIVDNVKSGLMKHDLGFWRDVPIGQRVILTDGFIETQVEINGKKRFSNPGEAWFSYKTNNNKHPIFPELEDVVSMNDVNNYYKNQNVEQKYDKYDGE